MPIQIELLPEDEVEVMTASESKAAFGIDFNEGWRIFLQRNRHYFTVKEVKDAMIVTSLFTAKKGHIEIETKYVKRLAHRPRSSVDTAAWLSRIP